MPTLRILLAVMAMAVVGQTEAQLFRLVMDPGNFGAVRQACRALGGDLASIRSDTEMNQVIALLDAEHAIPPVFYLGGAASGPGNWAWIDGADWGYVYAGEFTVGLDNPRENKLVVTSHNGQPWFWDDWGRGESTFPAVCRMRPSATPTGSPTTSSPTNGPPTPAPTAGPTNWFEHASFATTIEAVQDQVNALALTEVSNRAAMQSSQVAMQSMAVQLANLTETNRALQTMVYQTREAILAAVDAFGSARALYTDSSNGGQCSGAACQPRIEANGADMMLVAIEGSIKMETQGCGLIDPCRSQVGVDAVVAAMAELRNA